MDLHLPRRRRTWLIALVILGVAVPGAIGVWNALATQRRLDAALLGTQTQAVLDQSLQGVTALRVWGAGMRTGDDGFCGCAIVPKPERVYYETADAAEIQKFIAILRPRPYLVLDPPCRCCGQVTIDFLRGEQRLLSIHVKHGPDLYSNRGYIPITRASFEELEAWLAQRQVRDKIQAAWNHPAPK